MTELRISARWGAKKFYCRPPELCGGICCSSIWDFVTDESIIGKKNRQCGYLGDRGCTLPMEQRPYACLLYPFRLNDNNMLVLHFRIAQGTMCKGCYEHPDGKMVVEEIYDNLVVVFGKEVTDRIVYNTTQGRDTRIVVTDEFMEKLTHWGAINRKTAKMAENAQKQA